MTKQAREAVGFIRTRLTKSTAQTVVIRVSSQKNLALKNAIKKVAKECGWTCAFSDGLEAGDITFHNKNDSWSLDDFFG